MRRGFLLASIYLAAGVLALVLINASDRNWQIFGQIAVGLIVTSALALGWGSPNSWFFSILVPWALIPISFPLGHVLPNPAGEETISFEVVALVLAILSSLLIFIAACTHFLYDRWHQRSTSTTT
jgi:hypothetical protein